MRGMHTGWRASALALAWLAGVALHLQERSLAPITSYGWLAVGGACAVLAGLRWRRVFVLAVVGALLAGVGASGMRAAWRMADGLAPALEGVDLVVTGVVASLPQHGPTGSRFRFEVESATASGGAVVFIPRRIALGWYRGSHEDAALAAPDRELRAGQRWRFGVRLRRPHGTLNPHGHDFELSLLEQGVRATGAVRDAPTARLVERAAGVPVERFRQWIRDAILDHVPDRRAAGVIAALTIGDQGSIEREDWELFRNTGVAHLVAISGLHITMLAWLATLAVGGLWRTSRRACLALPAPSAAQWGGLACAVGYAVLAGWGVPAQRTVWMLATVTVLQASTARWPWPLVLLAAAVIVSAGDPWALLQPGFWLSFMAVGLLLASSPATSLAPDRRPAMADAGWARRIRERVVSTTQRGVRTQVIATLGLTPLTLIFFQQVSVVGFVANLLAIPLVTLLVTPLSLLGTLVPPLWSLAALGVRALADVLAMLSGLPGSVWRVPAAPAWAQAAGLLAAALLVLPVPWRIRGVAAVMMLPLLAPGRTLPAHGHFDLLALDVGQGTSVLVRTREHLLVYDAGPQYARDSDAGQRVLLPVLRAQGTARIDRLVLSHRDSDHVGGARTLLSALPVVDLMSSLEAGHALLASGQRATRCIAGQQWQWDGVRFEVLRPRAGDYERMPALRPNALSCVVRVSGGGRSALLTGDIERAQEAELVTVGAALRSDVLLAPHHGSRSSSTASFLDAVSPRLAVFQAGYRSRFGHPAADVVARYRERAIVIAASPACGAWAWSAAGPPEGSCYRDTVRRYWHLPRDTLGP